MEANTFMEPIFPKTVTKLKRIHVLKIVDLHQLVCLLFDLYMTKKKMSTGQMFYKIYQTNPS